MALTAQDWSISALAVELKRDKRTIARIIDSGSIAPSKTTGKVRKIKYYKMSDIVAAMIDSDELDLQQERAKLAKKQTEKADLQINEMKGQLVDIELVKNSWAKQIIACRAKLLSLPTKMSSKVLAVDSLEEVQQIIKSHIHEALHELTDN